MRGGIGKESIAGGFGLMSFLSSFVLVYWFNRVIPCCYCMYSFTRLLNSLLQTCPAFDVFFIQG